MGLFHSEAERQRKDNLRELEDKRVAFARKLKERGLRSDRSLYGQAGGGFHGVALSEGKILYLVGPGPGTAQDFTVSVNESVTVRAEEVFLPSEGMGGFLGMGKKGGLGFILRLTFPDGTEGEVEIVSGQNCFFEAEGSDPLFATARRRGNANVVWEFRPIEQSRLQPLKLKWLQLLGDEM